MNFWTAHFKSTIFSESRYPDHPETGGLSGMSAQLRQYLIDAYIGRSDFMVGRKLRKDYPIQIDDQDDNDPLDTFCNIFVVVGQNNTFSLEMTGRVPLSREIADFAEIYEGRAEPESGSLFLNLSISSVEAINDLAGKIRASALRGAEGGSTGWESISARTISSLLRLVRVLREYKRVNKLR